MGSKLESNKSKVEGAQETQEKGLERASEDAEEVSEMKKILDSAPTEVDPDILEAYERTRDAVKSEASEDMESSAHSVLERGYEAANEAIQEATEQAGNSMEASNIFSELTGVGEFGRTAAESSAQSAEEIAGEFEANAEQASQTMEQSEDKYQQFLADILG